MEVVSFKFCGMAITDDRKQKKLVELQLERDYEGVKITVIQLTGRFTNRDTAIKKELRPGTQEYQTMENMICFMEDWCQEHDPFQESKDQD